MQDCYLHSKTQLRNTNWLIWNWTRDFNFRHGSPTYSDLIDWMLTNIGRGLFEVNTRLQTRLHTCLWLRTNIEPVPYIYLSEHFFSVFMFILGTPEKGATTERVSPDKSRINSKINIIFILINKLCISNIPRTYVNIYKFNYLLK